MFNSLKLLQLKNTTVNWDYVVSEFEYQSILDDWDYPWSGHKHFAYDMIRNLKPRVVVELGTASGTSLFSMAQACKDNKMDTVLYAVDTWEGDKHTGSYDERAYNGVVKIKESIYPNVNINLMRMLFEDARDTFPDGSIDILHIDGFHTYEAVKHDYTTWISKLHPKGIILFHDISETRADFGVNRFWAELKNSSLRTMEFHHSHGLGVYFNSQTDYDNLKHLETAWNIFYLRSVYQSTKEDLYHNKIRLRELNEIKQLPYFRFKAALKKIIGR